MSLLYSFLNAVCCRVLLLELKSVCTIIQVVDPKMKTATGFLPHWFQTFSSTCTFILFYFSLNKKLSFSSKDEANKEYENNPKNYCKFGTTKSILRKKKKLIPSIIWFGFIYMFKHQVNKFNKYIIYTVRQT